MNGSAVYGERVVIVEVNAGRVNLRTGRIASTDSSHACADNHYETVVWGDQQFRPAIESAEEAFERPFRVNSIHLLKEQEAESLRDRDSAQEWFGAIYQDWLVGKIQRALKRLKRSPA